MRAPIFVVLAVAALAGCAADSSEASGAGTQGDTTSDQKAALRPITIMIESADINARLDGADTSATPSARLRAHLQYNGDSQGPEITTDQVASITPTFHTPITSEDGREADILNVTIEDVGWVETSIIAQCVINLSPEIASTWSQNFDTSSVASQVVHCDGADLTLIRW